MMKRDLAARRAASLKKKQLSQGKSGAKGGRRPGTPSSPRAAKARPNSPTLRSTRASPFPSGCDSSTGSSSSSGFVLRLEPLPKSPPPKSTKKKTMKGSGSFKKKKEKKTATKSKATIDDVNSVGGVVPTRFAETSAPTYNSPKSKESRVASTKTDPTSGTTKGNINTKSRAIPCQSPSLVTSSVDEIKSMSTTVTSGTVLPFVVKINVPPPQPTSPASKETKATKEKVAVKEDTTTSTAAATTKIELALAADQKEEVIEEVIECGDEEEDDIKDTNEENATNNIVREENNHEEGADELLPHHHRRVHATFRGTSPTSSRSFDDSHLSDGVHIPQQDSINEEETQNATTNSPPKDDLLRSLKQIETPSNADIIHKVIGAVQMEHYKAADAQRQLGEALIELNNVKSDYNDSKEVYNAEIRRLNHRLTRAMHRIDRMEEEADMRHSHSRNTWNSGTWEESTYMSLASPSTKYGARSPRHPWSCTGVNFLCGSQEDVNENALSESITGAPTGDSLLDDIFGGALKSKE